MNERKKTYFRLKFDSEGDYLFESENHETLRFAGGGNGRRKFIIDSLINLYGEKEGQDIFNKFLNGIDNIKNMSRFKEDTAVFVLYPPKHVFKD